MAPSAINSWPLSPSHALERARPWQTFPPLGLAQKHCFEMQLVVGVASFPCLTMQSTDLLFWLLNTWSQSDRHSQGGMSNTGVRKDSRVMLTLCLTECFVVSTCFPCLGFQCLGGSTWASISPDCIVNPTSTLLSPALKPSSMFPRTTLVSSSGCMVCSCTSTSPRASSPPWSPTSPVSDGGWCIQGHGHGHGCGCGCSCGCLVCWLFSCSASSLWCPWITWTGHCWHDLGIRVSALLLESESELLSGDSDVPDDSEPKSESPISYWHCWLHLFLLHPSPFLFLHLYSL